MSLWLRGIAGRSIADYSMQFNTDPNLQSLVTVSPFLPTLLAKELLELLDTFTQACQVFYAALPIHLAYSHRSVYECKEREGGKETRKKKKS